LNIYLFCFLQVNDQAGGLHPNVLYITPGARKKKAEAEKNKSGKSPTQNVLPVELMKTCFTSF
jgi:hypothetical protein